MLMGCAASLSLVATAQRSSGVVVESQHRGEACAFAAVPGNLRSDRVFLTPKRFFGPTSAGCGTIWDASPLNTRICAISAFSQRRMGRDARFRAHGQFRCGRSPDDHLFRPRRKLGNRSARRSSVWVYRGRGYQVTQIYRAPNNPLIHRLLSRFRGDRGGYISKGVTAARRAYAALYRGEHLTMLADQKPNEGIPIPFFGRPAVTATALALLALRFDCDVLPARVERLHGARFRLTVFPPLPLPRSGDQAADVAALTANVTAILEAWIRDRPEEWLWVHRRWPD